MRSSFKAVRSGDAALCTQSFGNPGAPPILLVMGATASMMWWPDSLCHALAEAGHLVIRFDHRDTGRSSTSPPGQPTYVVEDLADDVIAILDQYELIEAHIVGMSLGAFIAQLVALRDPQCILSLTLIAAEPLGGDPVESAEMSARFLRHFASIDDIDWSDREAVRVFLEVIAKLSSSPGRGFDRAATAERIDREIGRSQSLRSAFNHSAIAGDLDRWNLQDIEVPTLIIHGVHDPIIPPANACAIHEQIKGSTLHMLPEAGHELHGDDLPHIARLILNHVTRARPQGH